MTDGVTPAPALLQQRPFILFWLSRLCATMGYQMLAITIGWTIYELTNSALDLGLVGLIQFVPAVVLTLAVGHAADRYDRRTIVRIAHGTYVVSALIIAGGLFAGALSRELLFAVVFLIGCARAFELPTAHALVPALVPAVLLPRAVAAWTSANQVAVISGPAFGGLIYLYSPVLVGVTCIILFSASIVFITLIQAPGRPADREPPTLASVLAGFHYIRTRPRLLGVITLDLFVVVMGGATALLPIFAKDILDVGPLGLGLLRSAPAVGALVTAAYLSRFPVERHIGIKMFAVSAVYGLTTIVFGLSTSFPLSLVALALLGGFDAISVVIRFTLVQLETPDTMRGRVGAINYLFVGSSNTLGEFRAGAMAAGFGAAASVLLGGVGALAVVGLWMLMFPDLRRVDRFEVAEPNEERRA